MRFVVICLDIEDDKRRWYLTTRRVFSEFEAAEYMKAIHPARHPRAIRLESFIEMLPRGVEVTP